MKWAANYVRESSEKISNAVVNTGLPGSNITAQAIGSAGEAWATGTSKLSNYDPTVAVPKLVKGGVENYKLARETGSSVAGATAYSVDMTLNPLVGLAEGIEGKSHQPSDIRSGETNLSLIERCERSLDSIAATSLALLPVAKQTKVMIEKGRSTPRNYAVYTDENGVQRIIFKADEAFTKQEARPGRNMTNETGAGLTSDGMPYVNEGRHRAIGAAQGDLIPADKGGIPEAPGYLDYIYDGPVSDKAPRIRVKDLRIDKDPRD